MSDTVFVVIGSTGEYSNRTEWCVAVFTDRGRAQRFVLNSTAAALAAHAAHKAGCAEGDVHSMAEDCPHAPPGDPHIRFDYTGVIYCIGEAPLMVGITPGS